MVLSSFLFENVEELTEEGLPFVILFHNPDHLGESKDDFPLIAIDFFCLFLSSPNTRTDILLDSKSFNIKIPYYFTF